MSFKIAFPSGDIYRLPDVPQSLEALKATIKHKYPHKVPEKYIFTLEKGLNLPETLENESEFTAIMQQLKPGQAIKLTVKEQTSRLEESKVLNEIPLTTSREDLDEKPTEKQPLLESLGMVSSKILTMEDIRNARIVHQKEEIISDSSSFSPEQIRFLENLVDKKLEKMELRIRLFIESRFEALGKPKKEKTESEKLVVMGHSPQNELLPIINEVPALAINEKSGLNVSKGSSEGESLHLPKVELNPHANNTSSAVTLSIGSGVARVRRTSRVTPEDSMSKSAVSTGGKKLVRIRMEGRYICDGCGMNPLTGPHYKCNECNDFDYCESCKQNTPHPHPLYLLSEEEEKTRLENLTRSLNPKRSWIGKKVSSPLNEGADGQEQQHSVIELKIIPAHELKEPTSTQEPHRKPYKAKLVKEPDNPIPNITPKKPYELIFTLRNTGELEWPASTEIHCVAGCHMGTSQKVKPIQPGEEVEIKLRLQAPSSTGQFNSSWKLQYSVGDTTKSFGPRLAFEIQVEEPKDVCKLGNSILGIISFDSFF